MFKFSDDNESAQSGKPTQGQARDEVALAGKGGKELAALISKSKRAGIVTLANVTADALRRYPGWGLLLSRDDLDTLADSLAGVNSIADLMGRARTHEMADSVRANGGLHKMADEAVFKFADLNSPPISTSPLEALTYFSELVPKMGIDPERFAYEQRRRAFTLAESTNETITARIQEAIRTAMNGQWSVPQARAEIERLLNDAGVHPENPQYCFLPGQRITGNVNALSQSEYSGPAVEIRTISGRCLRVTVNHPIMTACGWKYAGLINDRDQILCYRDDIESFTNEFPTSGAQGRAINNYKIPARVEDIFETIRMQGAPWARSESPIGSLDFHGDAKFIKTNINSVWSYRILPSNIYSLVGEVFQKTKLMIGHIIPSCLPCMRLCLFDSAFKSALNACSIQSFFASRKTCSACGGIKNIPLGFMTFGSCPDLHPRIFKASEKSPGGDLKLLGDLMMSNSRKVFLDGIRNVKLFSWTGHIYNLQSPNGFIISEGIVTSNSEMVYRTNAMDSYQTAAFEEGHNPSIAEVFPCWQYLGIQDGREGDDHRPHFDKYYSRSRTFNDVRGPRVFNCRCSLRWIDKYEWEDAQKTGARIDET